MKPFVSGCIGGYWTILVVSFQNPKIHLS